MPTTTRPTANPTNPKPEGERAATCDFHEAAAALIAAGEPVAYSQRDFLRRLDEKTAGLRELLREFSQRLGDEADVNWSGGPNLAMRLQSEFGERIERAIAELEVSR